MIPILITPSGFSRGARAKNTKRIDVMKDDELFSRQQLKT
jgi:hypothetical protein